jgi:prepilin-type N-terminal cleavage/methylation domain-containing protein
LSKIFLYKFYREEGFTLLELLATIVVLSLFGYVLIAIIGGIAQQTSDTAQKQAAYMLGNAQMNALAANPLSYLASHSSPFTTMYGHILYTISLTNITTSEPTWASGMIDVKVDVSWNYTSFGHPAQGDVVLTEAFPS